MKTLFNFFFILLIFLAVAYNCDNGRRKSPIHTYQREDSIMSAKIGKKILYERDSLTVVDYSFWNDTYTLSNGVKVNKKLVP